MELNVKEEMKEGEENWFLHLFSVLFRGSLLLLLAFALAHSSDEFIEILLFVFFSTQKTKITNSSFMTNRQANENWTNMGTNRH